MEDRASVFQWIMSRPDALCALAADDPVLREKVTLLWNRVAALDGDQFLHRRAPCVNWVTSPATSTSTLIGEPLFNYPGPHSQPPLGQSWLDLRLP